jgi:hypothetical protein
VQKRYACLVRAARVIPCLVVKGVQAVVGGGARARDGLRAREDRGTSAGRLDDDAPGARALYEPVA